MMRPVDRSASAPFSDLLILPGLGGSGEDHWQSHLQRAQGSPRIAPADWIRPRLDDWIDALDRSVNACARPPVLVAHSLSCLLVAHWAARPAHPAIRGAFLVSVPNPQLPSFPETAASFAEPPLAPFEFPSVIISSADDPFGCEAFTRSMAAAWGSAVIVVGRLGHINTESGHGPWPLGMMLLSAFTAGLP